MAEKCCEVLGNRLNLSVDWWTNRTSSGEPWVPAFVEKVDPGKCIGCGLCVKICLPGVYKMEKTAPRRVTVKVNGKDVAREVDKVAVVVNPDLCMGDCHCHMICPVEGGAMICNPKRLVETEQRREVPIPKATHTASLHLVEEEACCASLKSE